jgi:ribosome biogenesis GTPase
MKTGIVIRALGQVYFIKDKHDKAIEPIPCFIRNKLKKQNPDLITPVAVGDFVEYSEEERVIEDVFPRKSKFSRRASGKWGKHKEQIIAANIDQVVISFSVDKPKPNNRLIDRFLVCAEADELNIVLCFNKWDLIEEESLELVEIYENIGYKVIKTSAVDSLGLDALKQTLKDNVSVIIGPSGVGKSTLLNAIEPSLNLKSKEVSQKTGKGKHTTTFAEMLPLGFGGTIIDTPGVREVGIINVTQFELSWLFPEMRTPMENCRFSNCLHKDEPDCGVKDAVEKGIIHILRYESYIRILDTIEEFVNF